MKKEEISLLVQMTKTLVEAELLLEKAEREKDYEKFNRVKEFMKKIILKIEGTTK